MSHSDPDSPFDMIRRHCRGAATFLPPEHLTQTNLMAREYRKMLDYYLSQAIHCSTVLEQLMKPEKGKKNG